MITSKLNKTDAWNSRLIKPFQTIKHTFQKQVENSEDLVKTTQKRKSRIIKRNSGIISVAMISGLFSNELVAYLYAFNDPVFAQTFLVMDSGIDYLFAFMAAAIGGGSLGLAIEKYYTRKIPKEEKAIMNNIQKHLYSKEGQPIYATNSEIQSIQNAFKTLRENPKIVDIMKQHYKKSINSVITQYSFFLTLSKILQGKEEVLDYYVFAYGIEDVHLTASAKQTIERKLQSITSP